MMKDKTVLFALKDQERICNVCGGTLSLRPLNAKEKKRINLKMDFPRGVFICDDCLSLATIGVRPIGIGVDEMSEHEVWTEFVEGTKEQMVLPEKEAVDRIISEIAALPEGIESFQIYLGTIFRCRGKGPSCDMYWLASSGMGDEIVCGGKNCRFDPYPEQYKRKYWYKTDFSWDSPFGKDIIWHWFDVIEKSNDQGERADALRRLGSIDILVVFDFLTASIFDNKDPEMQKIALAHLANRKVTEQVQLTFYHVFEKEESDVQITALRLLRDMPWSDKDIIKKVAYLTNRKLLQKDAAVTLRFLQKKIK
jgi:hypothetical protein